MRSSVVVITGALTGIGRATALAFAREGARLVESGRRDDAGRA
jgi:NAD(P)-dependent dehydrogenase (short-subunit alcohol dehydrogenase family)